MEGSRPMGGIGRAGYVLRLLKGLVPDSGSPEAQMLCSCLA